jgi:hypothetical protein
MVGRYNSPLDCAVLIRNISPELVAAS